jgi:hypothetical protein
MGEGKQKRKARKQALCANAERAAACKLFRTFSFEICASREAASSKANTSSGSDALKNMPMQCWWPWWSSMGLMRECSSITTALPLSSLLRRSARLTAVS